MSLGHQAQSLPSLADAYTGRPPSTGLICIDTPIGQICWVDQGAPANAEWFDDDGRAWPMVDLSDLLKVPA